MTTTLPFKLFGREVRPVAAALVLATFTVFWINILDVFDEKIPAGSISGDIVGAAAALAVAALVGGWVANSKRMAEVGMLLTAGVWFSRTIVLILLEGFDFYGVYLSGAWVVVAAGSFLLERADDDDLPLCRRRR